MFIPNSLLNIKDSSSSTLCAKVLSHCCSDNEINTKSFLLSGCTIAIATPENDVAIILEICFHFLLSPFLVHFQVLLTSEPHLQRIHISATLLPPIWPHSILLSCLDNSPITSRLHQLSFSSLVSEISFHNTKLIVPFQPLMIFQWSLISLRIKTKILQGLSESCLNPFFHTELYLDWLLVF